MHTHPRAYRLISVLMPVSCPTNRAHREKPGDDQHQQKQQQQQPLTPLESFHIVVITLHRVFPVQRLTRLVSCLLNLVLPK